MASKKYNNSVAKNARWIKEGRGSGRNQEYKPWLTVRDLPSDGRSHRVFGHKSQRTHHLFSDLELAVFLLLEWHSEIQEIREQFPLQLEVTLKLAKEAGIVHPANAGVMQYMSSDFLVNAHNSEQPKFVLQAKYTEALSDPRTVEKLELERRYWVKKEVDWLLITEQDIPITVFQNINWLYPAQRDEIDGDEILQRMQFYAHQFNEAPQKTLLNIAKSIDVAYGLPLGESLREIRQLLAKRCFLFDIYKPIIKLVAGDLIQTDTHMLMEALNVSNK
tara:strand:+ start:87257 stop:88084 length:828 start_codon:yes stop_codon:yes gene_type:complete